MRLDVILDSRAPAAELAALARLAEECGIGAVWVSSLNDSRDPWTNLVPAALATNRIGLGPVAVNPYDSHPLKMAAAFLTLNELAGGRARLVVGGGGEALQALGLVPERRVLVVREALEILRLAVAGQPVEYSGQRFQVRDCRFGWASQPPPPLFVAAGREQMLRMSARVADGIMMSDTPAPTAARLMAGLDEALVAGGKSRASGFWTSVFTAWHVGGDAAQMRNEARRWLFLRGIFRPWLLADFLEPREVELVMASRAAFARAFREGSPRVEGVDDALLDRLVDQLTLCGTADSLEMPLARLHALHEAGFGSVALRLYARPAESIRLIGKRLLPALRGG